jgi:hypothetical protein
MKTYKVTIDFKGAPSFSAELGAINEAHARLAALMFARNNGWTEKVAKSTVVEISAVPA